MSGKTVFFRPSYTATAIISGDITDGAQAISQAWAELEGSLQLVTPAKTTIHIMLEVPSLKDTDRIEKIKRELAAKGYATVTTMLCEEFRPWK